MIQWQVNPKNCSKEHILIYDLQNYAASSGGRIWVEYVKQYTGVHLYNYAVSGAVCSNDITPRLFTTFDFPAVAQYEVPAFIADSKYTEPDGSKFVINPPDETVYAIWIGTNDLGVGAFLTDSQVPGTNIVDYMDCVYEQLQRLYDQGGRYFVIMNVAPLNLAPLYGLPGKGGITADNYWPNKPSNITEISYRMLEEVVTVNAIYEYKTPFVAEISKTFPEARFALFDVHSLVSSISTSPQDFIREICSPLLTLLADDGHLQQPLNVLERHGSPECHGGCP